MNAEEIVRILREDYGINDVAELDRRIREFQLLDISCFCKSPIKEETKT